MLTRAKTGKSTLKVFLVHLEPITIKQSLALIEWFDSTKVKYNYLLNDDPWSLTYLPPHKKSIGFKWVFRENSN